MILNSQSLMLPLEFSMSVQMNNFESNKIQLKKHNNSLNQVFFCWKYTQKTCFLFLLILLFAKSAKVICLKYRLNTVKRD